MPLIPLLLLPAAVAAAPVMPERDWDVQHLDLAVRLDPAEERVTGTAIHTVTPLGRRAGHLRLHQVALDIREVRIDGEVVEGWRTRPGLLEIPMPARGDRLDVAVTFEATPETGLHWRGPDADRIREIWSHGQKDDNRHWFPGWDYPNDKYTYTGRITAPSDLVAVSNGTLAGREAPEEGWTTWTYQLEQPLATYLVSVAVGEYAVYPDAGAVPLEYFVPAYVGQQDTLDAAGITPPMLSWFEDTLQVDYPWPVYRQVWVQRFLYGAMENTTTTFHSDRLFRPSDGDRGALSERVIAHELAHQWFGNLVTCYGWRELWLNESFASYYAARWQRDHRGDDYFAADLWRWHGHAFTEPTPLSVRDGSDPPSAGPTTLYTRGGIVLHGLERHVGTEAFDAGITAYLRDHAHGLVESSDLRRALEDASGTHLGWYFDQFVYRDRLPEARTSWSWSDGELEVVLEQLGEGEALRLPVEIEIGTGGSTRRHRVWLDEGQTRLVVLLDEAPDWVAIDPEGATLADWDHQQPLTAWTAQLRGSPSPYARLVAADAMAEAPAGGEPVAPLIEALRDGNLSGHYRAHFAHALGRIGTERAVEGLLGGLADPSPRVREAIVEALGDAPPYDGVARALEGRYRADRDGQVRAAALQALASHDQGRALFIARRRVNQPETGTGPWEVQVAARLLGQHGEARDVGDLLQLTAPHLPHPARVAALSATTMLLDEIERDRREDRLRAKVSRRLEGLLDDGDQRVVRLAIALLGKAGDTQAGRTLQALATESEIALLREDASVAANAIRKRAASEPGAEAPPPGPDNERLQERLDELEERVDDLETWRR